MITKPIIQIVSLIVIVSVFYSCNEDTVPTRRFATGEKYIKFEYQNCFPCSDEFLGNNIELFKKTSAWKMAKAVYEQDTEEIERQHIKDTSLLRYQETKYGMTLLCWAVINDRYFSAKTLLKLGANPNIPMFNDYTALNYSCDKETTSNYIRLLLQYGGDIRRKNLGAYGEYYTLMKDAAATSLENVMFLEKAGLDISLDTNKIGGPFASALTSWNIEIAEYLISRGANYRRPILITETDTLFAIDVIKRTKFKTNSKSDSAAQRVLKLLREHGADSSIK